VRVLDENALPGGQYLRQLNPRLTAREPYGKASDRALLDDLARSGVTVETGAVVWGVFPERVVACLDGRRTFQIAADCLILAPGAYDRPAPVPGWTLPGVFTAGGALNLLKQHRMLPGRRLVLSGVGPLQLVLAAELVRAGAQVLMVCDPTSTLDSFRAVPGLLWTPERLRDGLSTLRRLRAAGVPIARRRAVIRVLGKERVEGVVTAAVDSSWRVVRGTEQQVAADAVCFGYGFVPSVELAELAGAPLYFDSGCQWWVPARSAEMETAAASVFAAGDGAGIGGALTARAEGAIAGLVAARRLGFARGSAAATRLLSLQRTWRRLQRARASLDRLFGLQSGAETWATDETVICRCEEVRLGTIREAVSSGARRLGEIKGQTRCGMGPCQGRMCGPFLARYVAATSGEPIEAAGHFRARPPVKPVPLEALLDAHA
jgi:NADPH-dependent 2,4-dienoyl-CoA reductase/sulfur reductase-like enzyme